MAAGNGKKGTSSKTEWNGKKWSFLSSSNVSVLTFLPLLRFRNEIFSSYGHFLFSTFVKCALLFFVFLQVLDGAGLDIDFHLASPEGKTLVFEQRKSDGVHT